MVEPTMMLAVAQQVLDLLSPKPVGALPLDTSAPGIDMQSTLQPPPPAGGGADVGSKINAELLKADGRPPAPPVLTAGSTGDFAPVPGQQSQTDITPSLPEATGLALTEGGDKMSLEAKMAIAAQMGSLLRGPGAPPPPGGGGGPGINMRPVFQDTLRGLYG